MDKELEENSPWLNLFSKDSGNGYVIEFSKSEFVSRGWDRLQYIGVHVKEKEDFLNILKNRTINISKTFSLSPTHCLLLWMPA